MSTGRTFTLKRELGSGAFGTVYLAEMESHGGFKKTVAIKLLNADISRFAEAGQRLRDEARLLGRLRHRNIVQVDDLVQLDGRWAVVMEHVPGLDLEVVLASMNSQSMRIPSRVALKITGAIARALDAAYNFTPEGAEPLRAVHRDIKPSNVRITGEGDVKVLDFGIARAEFEEREAKTSEIRYGSVGYMSPERILGEPEVAAGDVFAVGCILFELLTCTRLGRVELSPMKHPEWVQKAQDDAQAALPDEASPEIREGLAKLLAHSLAYDVEDRPTAAEVSDRCRELMVHSMGPDLESWAHDTIPAIVSRIGDRTSPARGVLSESRAFSEAQATFESKSNPTLVFDELDEPPVAAPSEPAPITAAAPLPEPESKPPMLLYGGIGALLIVVLLAFVARPDATPATTPVPTTSAEPLVARPDAPEPDASPEAPEPDAAIAEPVEAKLEPVKAESPTTTTAAGTTSTSSKESTPKPVEAAPAETMPAGPLLRAVKVTVAGATAVSARCGAVSGKGSTSALLRDVPAGTCSVTATVDGSSRSAKVTVNKARGVDCAVQGEVLKCS